MINVSLCDFAGKVRLKNRITYGDVQRLKRDVLPDCIDSREEAELLLELDREISRIDSSWAPWLVAMFVDFVVWVERPTGVVAGDTTDWLSTALTGPEGAHPTKTGRLIARAIADEAAMSDGEIVVPSASLPEKNSAGHFAAQALRPYALDRMD
jgi:hypothetical protein